MYNFHSFFNLLNNLEGIRGKVVGSETIVSHGRSIYIDTCFARDTGLYETAIRVNDDEIIVVEDYETQEEAAVGHEKWKKECQNKKLVLCNIQALGSIDINIYE